MPSARSAGAGRTRGGARGDGDARLHPPAGGAAGDARAPPDGLLRDAAAGRFALRRRARADEQEPARSAALAGTGFPIDRDRTADALGFEGATANSLDSVSDRDFALDYLSAAAQCSLHLSRLAEELIIWASAPFGFVKLSDQFSTGSSIMPQKRNPDAAELVRGHSGRIVGALTSLMVTMKGLPLAYSKDMQDDKEPVFEAHDLLMLSLEALAGMVETVEFVPERMRAAAAQGYSTATDLADWLVREADVPFREAHHITGAGGEGGRGTRVRPRRSAARRTPGDRRPDRQARVRRAQRRCLGRGAGPATAAPRPSGCGSRSRRRRKARLVTPDLSRGRLPSRLRKKGGPGSSRDDVTRSAAAAARSSAAAAH